MKDKGVRKGKVLARVESGKLVLLHNRLFV
jgi:hypothetical protein